MTKTPEQCVQDYAARQNEIERRMQASALRRFLIGKTAVPDHPETPLNPNGRNGFVIHEVRVADDRVWVRGFDTMWFSELVLLEVR